MRDMMILARVARHRPHDRHRRPGAAGQDKPCRRPAGQFRGFYGNEYYDSLSSGDLGRRLPGRGTSPRRS
jgi:hypothetical protein